MHFASLGKKVQMKSLKMKKVEILYKLHKFFKIQNFKKMKKTWKKFGKIILSSKMNLKSHFRKKVKTFQKVDHFLGELANFYQLYPNLLDRRLIIIFVQGLG